MRVLRVVPDQPAIDRVFDYLVEDDAPVAVGTIVRVPLQGRRVRGWVVAVDVEPEADLEKLKPILAVTSAGPPSEVVALAEWTAHHYCGPLVHVLRAASPPNQVRSLVVPRGSSPRNDERTRSHVVVAPGTDRRDVIAAAVAAGGSTIVVTPAPGRARPLVAHLRRLGHRVLVFDGQAADAERTRAWADAVGGGCVVVGGRTAVFAPVPDLASVVVLDDFDEALAEERVPTWHTREVAAERAQRAGAALTLITPLPTPAGVDLAGEPTARDRTVMRAGWPRVEVVDLRDQPGRGLLTDPLAHALHQTIDRGAKACCIVNRKGRAQLLRCARCDAVAQCEVCTGAVVEADDGGLVCARCGAHRPRVCLACGSMKLKRLRPGVARLAEEIDALVPSATVADVDAATDAVPDAQVLVGTESLLHRPARRGEVGLVAFLDFDQELLAPRVHAAQQAFALLVRGARLLGGRAEPTTRLLVQTRLPEHPVLGAAGHADPTPVLAETTTLARDLAYPPFGGLALVSGDEAAIAHLATNLGGTAATARGPAADGTWQVRAPDAPTLAAALATAAPEAKAHGRLRIEVDPVRI